MFNFIRWLKDWFLGTPPTERGLRSPHWEKTAKEHLKEQPVCQYCGGSLMRQVHHKEPYHLRPDLELDKKNLITLCMCPLRRCHLKYGHLGNWKSFNPKIQEICDARKDKRARSWLGF
jgi:5-methylcytosine-specific restriction protein A